MLFNLSQFLLTVIVFLPVLFLAYGVVPGAQTFAFPIFLLLQVLFILGAASSFRSATAYFRDVQHLVEVGLNMAFWATPILYEYTLVPERFRFAILLTRWRRSFARIRTSFTIRSGRTGRCGCWRRPTA